MKKQITAAVATACAVAASMTVLASPAWAQSDTVWEMPDVKSMVLQAAMDDIQAVAAPVELNISTYDIDSSQKQLNLNNWIVCGQSPKAGSAISQKTKKVSLAVSRPNVGC